MMTIGHTPGEFPGQGSSGTQPGAAAAPPRPWGRASWGGDVVFSIEPMET